MSETTVLLTGATGFVGSYLFPQLAKEGRRVRCVTRNRDQALQKWPDREWVEADAADRGQLERALEGCDAAYYLMHGMAEGDADFRKKEAQNAQGFAAAAAAAGVGRIIYLGGVAPLDVASEHLRSRLEVGEALRSGSVKALELRASMIVGHGSLSWLIVRDLAARLPIMILPRWLRSRTEPVGIDDVVVALVRSLEIPLPLSCWFDIPGPEAMAGREILERTAAVIGIRKPAMLEVPVLTPWLSSHWVRYVTRADWSVAREVVLGLGSDLLAQDNRFWTLIGHRELIPFNEMAQRALDAEASEPPVPGGWAAIERWVARMNG